MNYTNIQKLNSQEFKRFTGVHKSTFNGMLKAWDEYHISQSNAGRPSKLNRAEQLLVALQYWREYRTYFHIAQDWEISEATVCRIVHRVETVLLQSGRFRIPGKKRLLQGFDPPDVVILDVTETPIERPKKRCDPASAKDARERAPRKRQKSYYSGKKKQHTLKCQVLAERDSGKIICLFFGEGSRHDFQLFKNSGIHIHPQTPSLHDSRYQGIKAYHDNSYVPKKKPKNGQLTQLERDYNCALSQERIGIEHINRNLKIFKILSGRYRNRRSRYNLRCDLVASLYNYELSLAI